ncbi:MAG: glycosyltransferase family 1 protein, partial [Nitrospirota bacterium]|nr:glycosyltransferase family 1 protein [Nitrospirota bacterium]
RFKDDAYRQAMVERAYEYVLAGHTYRHRVDRLLRTVVADGLPSW